MAPLFVGPLRPWAMVRGDCLESCIGPRCSLPDPCRQGFDFLLGQFRRRGHLDLAFVTNSGKQPAPFRIVLEKYRSRLAPVVEACGRRQLQAGCLQLLAVADGAPFDEDRTDVLFEEFNFILRCSGGRSYNRKCDRYPKPEITRIRHRLSDLPCPTLVWPASVGNASSRLLCVKP